MNTDPTTLTKIQLNPAKSPGLKSLSAGPDLKQTLTQCKGGGNYIW